MIKALALILLLFATPVYAAFPTVAASSGGSVEGVDVTDHDVSLPSGIVAGNLLLCFFGADGTESVTWPAGWTEIKELQNTDDATLSVAYRKADGTETSPITVTTGTVEESAHLCYRITGARDPSIQAPEVSTGATADATANPDPDSLTPTGGAKDYLWFAVAATDAGVNITAAPANYGNLETVDSGGAGPVEIGVARRTLNASSENPGTFTAAAADWAAATVVIHPSPARGGGPIFLD